ncbi:hypothetical protein BHM03_00045224 [Ensete ventricosum]|nr:hypothetical protein BHM03_00045224 [Ensete ventricosum]
MVIERRIIRVSPRAGRRNRPRATDHASEEDSRFFFSLSFFLPPSIDTARNRLTMVEINRYRPTATGDGQNRSLLVDFRWKRGGNSRYMTEPPDIAIPDTQ